MNITVITLNYNGAESTIKLLESLKGQTDPDFSIIVADNRSSDVEKLRDHIGGTAIHLIENGDNLGFAGGNNPALRYAFQNGSDWAVLINPDTWVETDFIARLKAVLGAKTGLVGLPLDEGGQTAYGGVVRWFRPSLGHAYGRISEEESLSGDYYPIGGGLAISKNAYQKIGGLDEKYFLYFEDADYALKAKRADIPVGFTAEPVIHHAVSATTRKLGSPLLLRYHYRNALYFNHKNGPASVPWLIWFWSAGIIAKQLLKIAFDIHPAESRAILAGVVDFHQNRMGRISHGKIKIGIECENLEDGQSRWGIGHLTLNLLEEYAKDPIWHDQYELYLYFKNSVPADPVLKNPIFKKRVSGTRSFNIFYHILMPLRALYDRLDWMFFPAYMLPPLYAGSSIVLLTGDVYYEYKRGSLPFRYRLAYGLFTNWAARSATKIMAISESSKREVSHLYGIGPERIFVSRLGVENPPASNENKYGQYILYVGQMFPRRSARESLRAFETIAPGFPDLKFILVGRDKYQPAVIAEMVRTINEKLGSERVIHYDYIESDRTIRDLYAHAKLFVYISSHEAFGLPPVEAAGYGVPVVVKDSDINHELFGDAAFFVRDQKDIAGLAATLKDALTNPEKRSYMTGQYAVLIPKLSWHEFAVRFFKQFSA